MTDKNKEAGAESATQGKMRERAFGPAVDAFGKELTPLGTAVGSTAVLVGSRITGAIQGLVYGYDTVSEWLRNAIAERLKDTPNEKIVEPDPRIAVPAIQALTYSINEEHIRQMFANLLTASMKADTKESAHPAFTELIKEMTSFDALVLQQLRTPIVCFRIRFGSHNRWNELGIEYSAEIKDVPAAKISLSLNNLVRLGLLRETPNEWSNLPDLEKQEKAALAKYEALGESLRELPEAIRESTGLPPSGKLYSRRDGYKLSSLGRDFVKICLP